MQKTPSSIKRVVPVNALGMFNLVNCILFMSKRYDKIDKIPETEKNMLDQCAEQLQQLKEHTDKLEVVPTIKYTPKPKKI